MSEEIRKILEFKHNFIEDNYKRYKEVCSNAYYKTIIRNKMYEPALGLYNEAIGYINLLEREDIPAEIKIDAITFAIISLAAIQDEKLEKELVLARK